MELVVMLVTMFRKGILRMIGPIIMVILMEYSTKPVDCIVVVPAQQNNPCLGLPNGVFISNSRGCEYFYYCHNGQALEANCPGDLWFDLDSGICQKKENVDCLLNEVIPIPPIIDLDEPIRCPATDSTDITFFGSTVDCGRYYICYHSRPLRQQCISDMHWNEATQKCDHPKNAKCRLKPEMPICPSNGQTFYPHPEECDYFIYCYNGYSTVQQCPFYHHWDVATQSCRWRNVARCALNE